jgi:hypothetical protein
MSDALYFRQGKGSALNISIPTLVLAVSPEQAIAQARVMRVNVLTAGTGSGTVNDSATVAGATAANQVATIPDAIGSYLIDFPLLAGLVIVPGAGGQVVSVSYD